MSSTIKVNNIQNLAGDDSGIDLSTNDQIILKTANTTAITVNSSQNVALASTASVSGLLTASSGVAIGGTGSANTLDDYEEGTFTLSVSTSGYSLIDTSGFYTKIGRQVTVVGHVKFDPVGSANSSVAFTGLPFTSALLNSNTHYAGVVRETVTSGDIFVAQQTRGTANMEINSMDGVGSGQNQIFVANRSYSFNITYFV